MGHPKKTKKKYSTPSHPWQKERIDEEKELLRAYGLKNKKEIWKMNSVLRNFKDQVKRLQALSGKQVEIEKNQLFDKLLRIGLISEGATFDDVLGLGIKAVMERRLQTLVVRKELARTMNQARQFLIHNHITIGGEKITSPSYLVPVALEETIAFSEKSNLADEMHSERIKEEGMPKKPERKETKKKDKKVPQKKEEKKLKEEKENKLKKEKAKKETSEPSKAGDKK